MIRIGVIILGVLGGVQAQAADLAAIPNGCTATLTIQTRGCEVSHVLQCTDLPDGHVRLMLIKADGLDKIDHYGPQGEFLAQFVPVADFYSVDPAPKDLNNVDELLADGIDTFDFQFVGPGSFRVRLHGFDKLTGRDMIVDGLPMLEAESELFVETMSGAVFVSHKYRQYLDPTRRLFGVVSMTNRVDGKTVTDNTPVDFIFPGEAGFLAAKPLYDCSVELSMLPQDRTVTGVVQ